MSGNTVHGGRGIEAMFISAAIFGFFGFLYLNTLPASNDGLPIPCHNLFVWVLRGSAAAFALSAIVTMAHARAGQWMYAVLGLLSAVGMLAALWWDIRDPDHSILVMYPMVVVPIFAIWNGWGSIVAIRALLARPPAAG